MLVMHISRHLSNQAFESEFDLDDWSNELT
jgi:hypothetical protein